MNIRIECPVCRQFLNPDSDSIEQFRTCPHCGIYFYCKDDPEKRDEVRIKKEVPFSISHKGRHYSARTVNLSKKGVGLKILGSLTIPPGDTIYLNIRDYYFLAKIIWISNKKDKSITTAGLRIQEGSLNPFTL